MLRRAALLSALAAVPAPAALAQTPASPRPEPLQPGAVRTGALTDADAPFASPRLPRGEHRAVALPIGPCPDAAITIEVRSADFDAYLQLAGRDGAPLAEDDSSGGAGDARVVVRGSALAGATLFVVSRNGAAGTYEVELRQGMPPAATTPDEVARVLRKAELALQRNEARHGPDATAVADRCLWLARALVDANRAGEALPVIERARGIREAHDLSLELVAECWRETGQAHATLQQPAPALAAFTRARELCIEEFGESHRGLPALQLDIAAQQFAQDDRDAAIAALREGIRLFDRQRNPDTTARAVLTTRLANALAAGGDHAGARQVALDAIAPLTGHVPTLGLADNQLGLASLLRDYAEPAAARDLLARCGPVLRARLPATHRRRVELAWLTGAVALATARTDELRRATAEMRELLTTKDVVLPWPAAMACCSLAELMIHDDPPGVVGLLEPRLQAIAADAPGTATHARMTGLLALAYWRSGRREAARSLLLAALDPGSPFHGRAEGALDRLHVAGGEVLGDSDPALARQCITALLAGGTQGPSVSRATRLDLLARLHLRNGDVKAAREAAQQAADMALSLFGRDLPALSDEDGLQLYASLRPTLDLLLGLQPRLGEPTDAAALFDHVAKWRTRVLRGEVGDRKRARERVDAETMQLLDRLRAVDRAATIIAGDLQADATRRAGRLAELAGERRALERTLADRAREASSSSVPTSAELRRQLANDAAFVDFVVYDRRINAPTPTNELVAFVVRREGPVRAVWLGDASPIEGAMTRVLQLVGRRLRPDAAGRTLESRALSQLADLVLGPLQPHLADVRKLVIATDGPMATVPFAALPGRQADRLLIEDVELTMVGAADDLVATEQPATRPALLLLGDVDFGGSGPFAPLPGTGREIDAILATARELLPAGTPIDVLRGAQATSDALAGATNARSIVHLATHGARLEAPSELSASAALGRVVAGNRAALALAGANLGAAGLLSANRLSWLDLSHCDLAVLSACETALGTPFAGEQLLGLRRSLRLAGARRSMTTLWRVDDRHSSELIDAFYRELWGHKTTPATALRAAQLHMLAANRRNHDGDPLPATWAGYVVEGAR